MQANINKMKQEAIGWEIYMSQAGEMAKSVPHKLEGLSPNLTTHVETVGVVKHL